MALNGIELRQEAAPCLRALSALSHTTVHMAVLDQREAMIIEKVEPPGVRPQASWVGKRLELHCSAAGKVLLAYLPEQKGMQALEGCRLPRHNDNTITSLRRLEMEIAEIRRRGYSIEDEEDVIGTRCVGAPVLTTCEEAIAAVSVAGTTEEIKPETIPHLVSIIKQTTAQIAEKVSASDLQAKASM
ncbi:MAG TPA: IclR family transcriptional regulator [Terriglobia bacterium]|nr:IclR family transcriptional regulator [Terriglobia bacterium]